MTVQGVRRGKRPVLRMPLDLGNAVDLEVYNIFTGMSGPEAKNFLCSAILYYARSPLVLSANALIEALSGANLDRRFGEVLGRLGEVEAAVRDGCLDSGLSQAVIGTDAEGVASGSGGVDFSASPEVLSEDALMLGSLKQRFRV